MLATGFHSVPKSSESETTLFPRQKSQTRHQIFPLKKMTPMPFLLHFYVTIFPISSQNCKKNQLYYFLKIFLLNSLMFAKKLPAPIDFFRHRKVQNHHKPANPPLLGTLGFQYDFFSQNNIPRYTQINAT